MNEEIILKMVEPYLKENSITYFEFDNIFSFLSKKEQYVIVNMLHKNDILLCDDKEIMECEFKPAESNDFEQVEKFEILYDNKIFSDKELEDKDNFRLEYRYIKQSNNILCRLLKEGNEQAKQYLCIKNKKLVDKWVYLYGKLLGNDLAFEDLEQAGMIGLLKAADRFDCDMGYEFSTYAAWWIRQSIHREITNTGFRIRIPVHMMDSISKVTSVDNRVSYFGIDFQQRVNAIKEVTNFTEEKIIYCILLRKNYLSNTSLNKPVSEEETTEIQDLICDNDNPSVEEIVELHNLQECLTHVLSTLTERERNILINRFGLIDGKNKTLEEVGKEFNVTRERIRQIEAKALRKLRHPSRSKKLKGFLD